MKRKRAKKANPFIFKARPLTKAEKAKLTKERNELTKEMRAIDPFYIHPRDVPSGKAYQWFALEIMGHPNDDAVDRAKEDGWKPVPFSRHDFARKYSAKGKIVIQGMLLMENSSKVSEDALKKEQDMARQMLADSPCSPLKNGGRTFHIVSDNFIVSSDYARVPLDSPSIVVPITISFLMNANWQDAAASIGLTNEEYARRRLLMTMPILAGDSTSDSVYEPVTLRIER